MEREWYSHVLLKTPTNDWGGLLGMMQIAWGGIIVDKHRELEKSDCFEYIAAVYYDIIMVIMGILGTGCIFSQNLFCSRNGLVNQLICGTPGKRECGWALSFVIVMQCGHWAILKKIQEAKHTQPHNLATETQNSKSGESCTQYFWGEGEGGGGGIMLQPQQHLCFIYFSFLF